MLAALLFEMCDSLRRDILRAWRGTGVSKIFECAKCPTVPLLYARAALPRDRNPICAQNGMTDMSLPPHRAPLFHFLCLPAPNQFSFPLCSLFSRPGMKSTMQQHGFLRAKLLIVHASLPITKAHLLDSDVFSTSLRKPIRKKDDSPPVPGYKQAHRHNFWCQTYRSSPQMRV